MTLGRKWGVICLFGIALAIPAAADFTYSFIPPGDKDLWDLPHGSAFRWGIDWKLPEGQIITGAKITYYEIYNWRPEPNKLHTTLLDSAPKGVKAFTDYQAEGNFFSGPGTTVLGVWTDPNGTQQDAINLSYDISSDYFSWLSDGNFGFGIDPDCHFYNRKVKVTITTTTVPTPDSAVLGLFGAPLAAMFFRRR